MSQLGLEDIPRLMGYQFFQYALVGGIIASVACSVMGLFLVLRKESMIGDGVAHTSFGGIAIGLYLGVYPIYTALVVSILAVMAIQYLRRQGYADSDSAIALMLALGFSTGLIVISLAGGFNVELFSYLFGSILTIDSTDLAVVAILGVVVLGFVGTLYKELLYITFDEDSARIHGIPVGPLSFGFNVLVAFTIVLSIKIIGVILVAALIVIPALSALRLGLTFRRTLLASMAYGVTSVVMGIMLSAVYDVATSGVIVFTAATLFVGTILIRRFTYRPEREVENPEVIEN